MRENSFFSTLSPGSMQIFNYIQKLAPIAKGDICNLMEKKITTVNRMIEPLIENELVVESGIGDSTGGRKPILYAVNDQRHYVGAINISVTYCEVSVMNFKMDMLLVEKFEISSAATPESVVDAATRIFHKQLAALGIGKDKIHGVGVSIFSSFNRETGRIYKPTILYLQEEWINYPLAQSLEERLELPVAIGKGTNAAAMLEYFYGKGRHTNRMLYILCAMNIRCAVVADGKLMSIAPNYEDAFGHMTIDFDGAECLCGNYGCVDCYTTIPAILKKTAAKIKKGHPTLLNSSPDQLAFKDICYAADQGDALAKDVIISAGGALGTALANYINLFCPDLVILSGLLVRESQLYYDVAVNTATKKSIFLAGENALRFERNGFFADPITAGAGSMMIETLMSAEAWH